MGNSTSFSSVSAPRRVKVYCPAMSLGRSIGAECEGDKCFWWSFKFGKCGVKSLIEREELR